LVGIISSSQTYFGEVALVDDVSEQKIIHHAREVAKETRREIETAGLNPYDFSGIARKYQLTFRLGKLPKNAPGCYLEGEREIIIDPHISLERKNFTFYHELMHNRIEKNDDLLTLLADVNSSLDEDIIIHRMCEAGAAEILMPSNDVRVMLGEYGFSSSTIPILCERYKTSSIAVALQMAFCASHHCYLIIAEQRVIEFDNCSPLFSATIAESDNKKRLVIIYSAKSSAAKYWMRRWQVIPTTHPIYVALQQKGQSVQCQATPFFPNGKGEDRDFDALYFKGKVFAFFNFDSPISNLQMTLF
jgi:Zn-dependent peptidase ImmA (M78 family)